MKVRKSLFYGPTWSDMKTILPTLKKKTLLPTRNTTFSSRKGTSMEKPGEIEAPEQLGNNRFF